MPVISRRLAPTTHAESAFAKLGLKLTDAVEAVAAKPEPIADGATTIRSAPKPQAKPNAAPKAKPDALDVASAPKPKPAPMSRSASAPGLIGELTDYITGSAMYPSVKFATATALGVMGTLISRRIAGPSGPRGTGTHLYQVLVTVTGGGKEHIRTTGKLLLSEAPGGSALIGAGRFKSGAGVIKELKAHPACLCIQDEFGKLLEMLADPRNGSHVRDINEVLRELWGLSWGRYDSPVGALDKSETILAPALSILGMSTPKELYRACKSRDIANGFLNRFMFVEEKTAPTYQKVVPGCLEPPQSIKDGLNRLCMQASILDEGKPSIRMEWGPGAEEVYDTVRKAVEAEADDRRRELFWRTPEKIVRVATIIAAGRFAKAVSREDMEWSQDWVRASDETLLAGVNEYMDDEKLEFGELCREIMRRVKFEGGEMTKRDLGRSFQNNIRFKPDLDKALEHLVETEQLDRQKLGTGGRPSWVYGIPKDGPNEGAGA